MENTGTHNCRPSHGLGPRKGAQNSSGNCFYLLDSWMVIPFPAQTTLAKLQ